MLENIENIIAIKLTGGSLTDQEQQLFDSWRLDPANAAELQEYEKIWNLSGKIVYQVTPNLDDEWEQFKLIRDAKFSKKRSIKPYWIISTAVAASIIITVGLFMLLSTPKNEIFTFASQQVNQKIVLPDQSEVWLNQHTQLTYCHNNQTHQREIQLNGEALFKVQKNGEPFIINTPQQIVTRVLGTEFNLKAYAADTKVQLAVISGKVSFGNNQNSTIVTKGQQIEYLCNENQLTEIKPVDENLVGWKTGIFTFNNDPLSKVAEVIGLYLNKTIEMPVDTDKLQYSGNFSEPTAETFAQIISVALNWNYTITEQKIVFTTK